MWLLTTPTTPTTVTVNGSTISWPDDGWYQVQSASDFSTVCEGGRACDVEPGLYIVINHSTQERFENITVESDLSSLEMPVINSNNYRQLITQAFEVFSGQVYDDRMVQFPYLIASRRSQLVLACANGGMHEQTLRLAGFGGAGNGDIVNGSFHDTNNPIGHTHTFDTFSSALSVGGEMHVDGLYRSWFGSSGSTIQSENLDYDFSYSGGSISVHDANTLLFRPFTLDCELCQDGRMEGSFTMQGSSTGDNILSVNVPTAFEYNTAHVLQQGFERARFFDEEVMNSVRFGRGVLEIESSSDSSSVSLDADTGDINTVLVVLVNSVGIERFIVDWSEWVDDLAGNRTDHFSVRSIGLLPANF